MSNLTQLLDRLSDVKILVAGEIGIDEYIWGDCHRISPEAPVPVVEVESQSTRLGLAANVAQNIAALGALTEVISVCGADSDAERMAVMLRDANIRQTIIQDESRPTLRKVRIIAQKQHVVRVDHERSHPLGANLAGQFRQKILERLEQYDGIILQDYGKGLWNTDTISIISMAKRLGKGVYVDPNRLTPLEYYKGATLLTPNMTEAEVLCGMARTPPKLLGPDDTKLRQLAKQIMDITFAEHSLITCAEWGMVGLERKTDLFRRIPTFAREVSDVTGAGDTVIAVMSLMHTLQCDIETCMKVANAAAGLVVGRMGAASVSRSELSVELDRLSRSH